MSMLGFSFFLLGITTCHIRMSERRNDITPLQTSLTFFSYLVNYLCTCTRKTFNSLQGKFFFHGDGNLAQHKFNVFLAVKGHLLV